MKALRFYDIWDHVPSNSGRSGGCLKFDSDGLSYADYSTLKDRQVDWLVNSSDLKGIHFERENGKILHVTFLLARQITFQCFWGFQESDLPRLTQFCSEHWQIVATLSSEFHALNLPTLCQSRLRRSQDQHPTLAPHYFDNELHTRYPLSNRTSSGDQPARGLQHF
ncbi:hypothetical protein BT69DRAFT_848545 [Atractiella rhizophila]|nr:hypothetical protein BT69DRAFT_848545 [Atractiella rhizophila]